MCLKNGYGLERCPLILQIIELNHVQVKPRRAHCAEDRYVSLARDLRLCERQHDHERVQDGR